MSDNLKNIENPVMNNENKNAQKINTEMLTLKESIRSKMTLTRIFAVVGSLFAAVGVGLLVWVLWQEFPGVIRNVISFLPLFIGQLTAIVTYLKKRDNVAWCEGASISLAVGVTTTIGLTSVVNNLDLGVLNCLLIDALLILPIVYVFNSVSVLPIFYGYAIAGSLSFCTELTNRKTIFLAFVIMTALLTVGAIFLHLIKNNLSEKRHCICVWLTVISVLSAIISLMPFLSFYFDLGFSLMLLSGFFSGMYFASGTEKFYSRAFKYIGIIGNVVSALILTYHSFSLSFSENYEYENIIVEFLSDLSFVFSAFVCFAFAILLITLGAWFGKNSFKENSFKLFYAAVTVALITSFSIAISFERLLNVFSVVVFILNFLLGVILIFKGVKDKKYSYMNFGIFTEFVLVCYLLSNIEITTLVVAIMFILSGAIILGSNFFIAKQIKEDEKRLSEVTLNEEEY